MASADKPENIPPPDNVPELPDPAPGEFGDIPPIPPADSDMEDDQ